MSLIVDSNVLARPDLRGGLEKAIRAAVGDPPGEWFVGVKEFADSAAWHIEVLEENKGFEWKRVFEGPDEQTGEFVAKAIADEISKSQGTS
jgi:hypothetical protein